MGDADPRVGWVLDRAARERAEEPGTIDLGTGERRTWSEVKRRVDGVATALASRDFERGDRVAILSLNSARHFELWYAIPASGLVMNDLNFRLAQEELRFICDDSKVKLLFVDENFLEAGLELRTACDALETLVWLGIGDDPPEGTIAYDALAATEPADLPEPESEDVAAIFYTGGTTGLPKGVMLTHRNLTANAHHMIGGCRLTWRDRYLHAAPQFHIADGALAYSITWVGGTHVFFPAFDPRGVVEALESEAITVTLLVPTMITMCVASGVLADANLSAMRLMIYGASPMPAEVQRTAVPAFACDFMQAYGMTEASHQMSSSPFDDRRAGTVGKGTGVDIAIMADDGTLLSPGEIGEVVINGPNVTHGYTNNPEANKEAFAHGWFHTGDQGLLSDDGYLSLTGRLKELINRAGEKISPLEVDGILLKHPAVNEAVCFAAPDEKYGEVVHAAVVLGGEATPEEIMEHCRTQMAEFKVPEVIYFAESLPRTATGKIQRRHVATAFLSD